MSRTARPRPSRGRRPSPARLCLGAGLLGVLALTAAPAQAAMPTRFIGIGTDGQRSQYMEPIAVADDGSQVLGKFAARYTVLRDVAGNVTRDVLAPGDFAHGASGDLRRILFETTRALAPGDANDASDLYVWDRPSDTYELVSRDAEGRSLVGDGSSSVTDPTISTDGRAVAFTLDTFDASRNRISTLYRYDASRSATTRIAPAANTRAWSIGADGTTLVSATEVISPYGRWARPGPQFIDGAVTSSDGSHVAYLSRSVEPAVAVIVDARTGASRSVDVPNLGPDAIGLQLAGVADDGASVTLGATLERDKRHAFGRLDHGGRLTQIGEDIPLTAGSRRALGFRAVLSPNGRFAATGLLLVALRSDAIPGTDATPPSRPSVPDYFDLVEFSCTTWWFGIRSPNRPRLTLSTLAQGSDLRFATKAKVTVWQDGQAKLSNDMTMFPGQRKDLWVGVRGGYRVDASITLTGGEVISGSFRTESHAPASCEYIL